MSASEYTVPPAFRDVMARVCTPVSVVTALDGERPHGTTVSAVTSLSLAPPMILVSLDRGSQLLELTRLSRRFGVNFLNREQADIALRFATKGSAKFEGMAWRLDTGVPRLPGVCGWVACDVATFVDGGDHVILLGSVVGADFSDERPLTYHARTFGTHAALDNVAAT